MTGRIQGGVFMLTCGKIVYYHGSSINKKSAVLADLTKQVFCQCLALISLAELAFTEEELRIVKSVRPPRATVKLTNHRLSRPQTSSRTGEPERNESSAAQTRARCFALPGAVGACSNTRAQKCSKTRTQKTDSVTQISQSGRAH